MALPRREFKKMIQQVRRDAGLPAAGDPCPDPDVRKGKRKCLGKIVWCDATRSYQCSRCG